MSALTKRRLTKIKIAQTEFSLPKSQEGKVETIIKALVGSTDSNPDLIDAIYLLAKMHKTSESSVSSDKFKSTVYNKLPKGAVHLKGSRLKEGLSQQDLSDISGVSRNNISKMENGSRAIGELVANKLAKCLKIDYRLLVQK